VRRRPPIVTTAVSLILCLTTAALWRRSFTRWDRLVTYRLWHGVGIGSAHGRIILNVRRTNVASIARDRPAAGWSATEPDMMVAIGDGGSFLLVNDDPLCGGNIFDCRAAVTSCFGWEQANVQPPPTLHIAKNGWPVESAPAGPRPVVGDRYVRAWVPHGLIVALTAVLPVAWSARQIMSRRRRRRLIRRGLCAACGYDVRATPKQCPECGTMLVAPVDDGTASETRGGFGSNPQSPGS
jgi:hypothetical protein